MLNRDDYRRPTDCKLDCSWLNDGMKEINELEDPDVMRTWDGNTVAVALAVAR